MTKNVCCFVGHRDIDETEELKGKLKSVIEKLITQNGVRVFSFGTRSEFNDLCYKVVTELKEKYADIQRETYLCRSETACLVGKEKEVEQTLKAVLHRDVKVQSFELIYHSEQIDAAKRGAYVKRNQIMIDRSDYCVFYYNVEYSSGVERASGTKAAYEYAARKKKNIINLFEGGNAKEEEKEKEEDDGGSDDVKVFVRGIGRTWKISEEEFNRPNIVQEMYEKAKRQHLMEEWEPVHRLCWAAKQSFGVETCPSKMLNSTFRELYENRKKIYREWIGKSVPDEKEFELLVLGLAKADLAERLPYWPLGLREGEPDFSSIWNFVDSPLIK